MSRKKIVTAAPYPGPRAFSARRGRIFFLSQFDNAPANVVPRQAHIYAALGCPYRRYGKGGMASCVRIFNAKARRRKKHRGLLTLTPKPTYRRHPAGRPHCPRGTRLLEITSTQAFESCISFARTPPNETAHTGLPIPHVTALFESNHNAAATSTAPQMRDSNSRHTRAGGEHCGRLLRSLDIIWYHANAVLRSHESASSRVARESWHSQVIRAKIARRLKVERICALASSSCRYLHKCWFRVAYAPATSVRLSFRRLQSTVAIPSRIRRYHH